MAKTAWAIFEPRGSFVVQTIRATRKLAVHEAVAIWGSREVYEALKEKARQGNVWPTLSDRPLNAMEQGVWDGLRKRGYTVRKVLIQEAPDA